MDYLCVSLLRPLLHEAGPKYDDVAAAAAHDFGRLLLSDSCSSVLTARALEAGSLERGRPEPRNVEITCEFETILIKLFRVAGCLPCPWIGVQLHSRSEIEIAGDPGAERSAAVGVGSISVGCMPALKAPSQLGANRPLRIPYIYMPKSVVREAKSYMRAGSRNHVILCSHVQRQR